MAKVTKLQTILKDLAKGNLVNGSQVRKALQEMEINVLRLQSEELKRLTAVVEEKKSSSVPATRKSGLDLEELITGGSVDEDGYYNLKASTFSKLSLIGEAIGRTNDQGYQLGHTGIGNLAQRLGLVLENYKVRGERFLNSEERALIESAILGAQTIERLPTDILAELQAIGTKDSTALLKSLSQPPDELAEDLIATAKLDMSLKLGTARVVYEFEDSAQNQAKGQLSAILTTKVQKYLRDIKHKDEEELGKKLNSLLNSVTDPFNISSSPTFIDEIEDSLDDAFYGRKKKRKQKVSKVRVHRRVPTANKSSTLKRRVKQQTKNLKSKIAAVKNKKKFKLPTVTLKAIINASLADYIIDRMGESQDPPIQLRNQTGRFAGSARLLTLTRNQAGLFLGTYSFMRNPYGTFLPGGNLHTQLRDPKIYIEGAINDIALEVLRKDFNGISLELS